MAEEKEVRIPPNRWNIIQRIIREYPYTVRELETNIAKGAYHDRLAREAAAVEGAFSLFAEEWQAVISERFWTDRDKNKPYEQMWKLGYSSRQMRRIAKEMIYRTGQLLGEIERSDCGQAEEML